MHASPLHRRYAPENIHGHHKKYTCTIVNPKSSFMRWIPGVFYWAFLSPATLILSHVVSHKVPFLSLPCPGTLNGSESSQILLELLFKLMAFAMRDTRDRSLAAKQRPKNIPLLEQAGSRTGFHGFCYAHIANIASSQKKWSRTQI